jgi:hypothetical protein
MRSSWLSNSSHAWLSSYVCTAHLLMRQAASNASPGGSKGHVSHQCSRRATHTSLPPPPLSAPGSSLTSGNTSWLPVDGYARGRRLPPPHPGRPMGTHTHVASPRHLTSVPLSCSPHRPSEDASLAKRPRIYSPHTFVLTAPITRLPYLSMPL